VRRGTRGSAHEYKLRRFVNDYAAPPKTAAKLSIAVRTFDRMRGEIADMGARNPHELMRTLEVSFIRDCAEMAARSSLTRTESRWGLYHDRADMPGRDDGQWGYHLNLRKGPDGAMVFLKRPVAPYFVPVSSWTGCLRWIRRCRRWSSPAGRRSSADHQRLADRLGGNGIRPAVAAHC
jgi:succinate dehydrogenase/fumarate reductase flavoprotein subunit